MRKKDFIYSLLSSYGFAIIILFFTGSWLGFLSTFGVIIYQIIGGKKHV